MVNSLNNFHPTLTSYLGLGVVLADEWNGLAMNLELIKTRNLRRVYGRGAWGRVQSESC